MIRSESLWATTRAGFAVVSISVYPVNLHGEQRARWYYSVAKRYLGTSAPPIAVIGHSLGGDAAILASQWLADDDGRDVRAYIGFGTAAWSTSDPEHFPEANVSALFLDVDEDGFWDSSMTSSRAHRVSWEWPHAVAHSTLPGGAHAYFNDCWEPTSHNDTPHLNRQAQLDYVADLVQRYLTMVFDAEDGSSTAADLTKGYVALFGSPLPGIGLATYRPSYRWRAGERQVLDAFEASPVNVNEQGLANTVSGDVSVTEGQAQELRELTAPANEVARVTWTGAGAYSLAINAAAPSFDPQPGHLLVFDVMVSLDGSNPEHLPAAMAVRLRDGDGDTARLPAGLLSEIDPASASQALPTSRFKTITLQLDAFVAANPELDLDDLDQLSFRFSPGSEGELYLDNISIVQP